MKTALTLMLSMVLATFTTAQELKPELLDGELTATFKIMNQDGSPAVGERYELSVNDGDWFIVQEAEVPADGMIRVEGMVGGKKAPQYIMKVGATNTMVGILRLVDESPQLAYEYKIPPSIGDMAPDIKMDELFADDSRMLSDYRGTFVFLDFWATWCGPCQKPMAHNQELLETKKEWNDKVVVVALSIDEEIRTVKKHVKKKGWDLMEHYFSADGEPGWQSAAPQVYGVLSIPTALIIDPDGKIVWRGNPNRGDMEKRIDRALSDWE